MQIPIRMISVATAIFWAFLLVFSATAVLSIKDFQINIENPQFSITADNMVLFSLPFIVGNKGFYNIGNFCLTTEIFDENGLIIRGFTSIPVIRKGEVITKAHNITLNIDDLWQRNQNFLFNDADLGIYMAVGMKIAEVIPIQASSNRSVRWGAPLYNFTLGEMQVDIYNATYLRVTVPISFENHAFFNIDGNIQIQMFNSLETLIGTGELRIEASSNTRFDGNVELIVHAAGMTESGHLEVYVATLLFNYGPKVIPYG